MQYFVHSAPLDISILFMKCLSSDQFKDIISCRIYDMEYRFQVGRHFWETRMLNWSNKEYTKYRLKGIAGKTLKNNECVAMWDQKRNIVIVSADSKKNMHWKDVERIQYWIDNHISRFSKTYCLNMNYYPTDTQKFFNINSKKK